MVHVKQVKPNTAYPLYGTWETIMKQLVERKGKSLPVKLVLTPGLFDQAGTWASGIRKAYELGYLEMDACLTESGNIHLRACINEGYMGDEDGFGVEPDDYLVGDIAQDGTFIRPLHIF